MGTNDRFQIETDGDIIIGNQLGIGATPTTNLLISEASGGTTPQIKIDNTGGAGHDSAIYFKTGGAEGNYVVGVDDALTQLLSVGDDLKYYEYF